MEAKWNGFGVKRMKEEKGYSDTHTHTPLHTHQTSSCNKHVKSAFCSRFSCSYQILKKKKEKRSLSPNQFVPEGCFLIGTHSKEHLHAPEW